VRALLAILLIAGVSAGCDAPVRKAAAADQPAVKYAPDGYPVVELDAIEVVATPAQAAI